MSKVLCIGDVHLKPVIFDKAEKILESGQADFAVQMGDLVDGWGEGFNLQLYTRALGRAIMFHNEFPNTLWCLGNHDYGYFNPYMGVRESGHSRLAEGVVGKMLKEMEDDGARQQVAHMVDNVIFTHAGLTADWVNMRIKKLGYKTNKPTKEGVLFAINHASPEELWQEDSPIWARPQIDDYEMWQPTMLQVVGHTPVRTPNQEGNVLSTDTHSTYRNGAPYGDRKFVIVDTETNTWKALKEDDV